MRTVKENYDGPTDDALTHILSDFLKTVPKEDREGHDLGYVMAKEKLEAVVKANPDFQHLVDVGALWHE
jgi:hypothetical protein